MPRQTVDVGSRGQFSICDRISRKIPLRMVRWPVSPSRATAWLAGGRSAISEQERASMQPAGRAVLPALGRNS